MKDITLINDFKKLNKITQEYLLNILYNKHYDKYKILVRYKKDSHSNLKYNINSKGKNNNDCNKLYKNNKNQEKKIIKN